MADQLSACSETFEEFKNSFSYGGRTDLLFKFLKNLPEEDAAAFLQGLVRKIGDSLDDGDLDRIVQHLVDGQVRAYTPANGSTPKWSYDTSPFATLPSPLPNRRVGLVSSGGHFVRGNDPAPFGLPGMSQGEAIRRVGDFLKSPPQLTEIPTDVSPDDLEVRHGGYDIRGARRDHNVVLPIDPLRRAEASGRIGELHPTAYSFVGAASQLRLIKETGPEWVGRFRHAGIDALILVPV